MKDDPISAMQFCTTPKGDLPHYSYIFRNLYPFGTDVKNVACYRLGVISHLYIQKGEEAMKTSDFQKYLGGTAVFMRRLTMATQRFGQLTSNDIYFLIYGSAE